MHPTPVNGEQPVVILRLRAYEANCRTSINVLERYTNQVIACGGRLL